MYKTGLLLIALLYAVLSYGQHNLLITIIHADNKTPLEDATVSIPALKKNVMTDSAGLVDLNNLAKGKYRLNISYAGFNEKEVSVQIPFTDSILEVELEPG